MGDGSGRTLGEGLGEKQLAGSVCEDDEVRNQQMSLPKQY